MSTSKLALGNSVAYRHYLITHTIHGFHVTKDGHHISWCKTEEEARKIIDLVRGQ